MAYDDITLTALEEALRDVCKVLEAHNLDGGSSGPELKKELAFRLMALADAGIRDAQELRNRLLATLPLAPAN